MICLPIISLTGCASLSGILPQGSSSSGNKTSEVKKEIPKPPHTLKDRFSFDISGEKDKSKSVTLSTRIKSVSVTDSDIRDVIRALFKNSDINVIIDKDVGGIISFSYKDMTLEEILESALASKGYVYTIYKDYIRIGKKGTRVFTLNLSADGEESVWESIEEELDDIKGEDGELVINPNAGTIMVTDTLENLNRIESYIDMIEEAMLRQVLIETKIIEVTLSDNFKYGIDYSLFPDTLGLSVTGTLDSGAALLQSLSPKDGSFRFGVTKSDKFSALIDILRTQGQVNVLSSPRIVAMNNMKASINIGEQVPVIERNVIDSGGGIRTEFDVRFEQAGIKLDVVPKIGASGEMTINVEPTITEQTGTVTTPDGLQTEPILNVRESSSTIRVRDNESIVIGGFIQNRKSEDVSKVPLLGDVPLIGTLFRNTDQKVNRVELLIVLSPRILNNKINAEMLEESLDRIKKATHAYSPGIIKRIDKEDFTRGFLDDYKDNISLDNKTEINGSRLINLSDINRAGNVSRDGMARLYLRKGSDNIKKGLYEKAINDLERSLFFSSLNGEAYLRLIAIYESIGNRGKSRELLERYLRLKVYSADIYNALAVMYSDAGDNKLGAKLLETAVEKSPREPSLYNNLGVIYKRMGKLKMAEEAFKRSLAGAPAMKEALYNLALVNEEMGLYEEALKMFHRFLDSLPPDKRRSSIEVELHFRGLERYINNISG